MKPNELRAEIVRRGTTISELADRIGISKETFWRRLKDPGNFTVSEILAIKEALGLDSERVFSIFFSDSFLEETKAGSRS